MIYYPISVSVSCCLEVYVLISLEPLTINFLRHLLLSCNGLSRSVFGIALLLIYWEFCFSFIITMENSWEINKAKQVSGS